MNTDDTQFMMKWVQGGMLAVLAFFLAFSISASFLLSDTKVVYAREAGSIYLNGETGDDENDGMSEENAVKSFEKAKEIATDNQNISVIYVSGTTEVSGDINLEGTNAILKRNPGFANYLLKVNNGDKITLRNITIDGGGENEKKTRFSLIQTYGDIDIEDGTILENNFIVDPTYIDANGGAIYAGYTSNEKVINMTGGEIRDNEAYFGGGLFLLDNTIFNMSGGVIKNNKVNPGKEYKNVPFASGGAIAAYRGATINLSEDALITGNSSEEYGGAIALGTIVDVNSRNVLNMTGGTISNNTAGADGGGIFVQAGSGDGNSIANISAGRIINNSMTGNGRGHNAFGGGGIYVNGESKLWGTRNNGILNLKNALITNNRAILGGGGYASCPTSETDVNVKNGVAILGNELVLGDAEDILIESGYRYGLTHSGDPSYNISPFMLGGTPYNWKDNNDEEIPLNKLSGILNGSKSESIALHTDVKEDSEAESLAAVIISGNFSATRGGGIGSNGTVNIGERKITSVKVDKTWKYDDPATRPTSITVELYRSTEDDPSTSTYIGAETVAEKDGKWELAFNNLPKVDANDAPYLYTVKERPIDGYAVQLSGNQNSGFTLTNLPETTVQVEKKWNGEKANQVEIKLLADGVEKDKAILTEDEQWTHTFSNLPRFDENDGHEIVYTVSEVALSGYTSSISGDASNGFIVTNTKTTTPPGPNPPDPNPYTPPSPVTPGRPVNPVPSTPSTPTSPNPNTPTVAGESRETPNPTEVIENDKVPTVLGESRTPAEENKRNTPTGDTSHLLLWASLLGLSILASVFYGVARTQKKRK